ncbi:hypothetical protein HaLaN_01101 [Haematococcus lacustris]|uniref:ATPase AAA-type core domain-containing protein n=1 Tax=Haematococcus lacustris TaxID=44745 RepID=A0A699YF62_HAELA|nr:hypothetical protein HaLaN_01101 [Haematococcus lacustris]
MALMAMVGIRVAIAMIVARARAPSVIFLDELDALAPARATRESTQDQARPAAAWGMCSTSRWLGGWSAGAVLADQKHIPLSWQEQW